MTKAEIAAQKRQARLQAELDRVEKMRRFEEETVRRAGGRGPVCGIDEAGRGPLAGPVAAAAVILPPDLILPYLNDSKKVTRKRREALCAQIQDKALAWAVAMVPPERIDEINILQATYEAMRDALAQVREKCCPGVLVNDAVTIPGVDILQVPVIKGDAKCISVAAASILAKVTRDAWMQEMDAAYPQYGFAGHKGYGTKAHCEAILAHGPCPIHRRTFLGKLLGDAPSPGASRMSGREKGREGEDRAALFLQEKGIRVLARNFRGRDGEIDIIGEEISGRSGREPAMGKTCADRRERPGTCRTLVFFEVKYRARDRYGDPAEAVTADKQRSICRAALYYLHREGLGPETSVRFDVLAVAGRSIRWIRDAFPFHT